MNKVLLTLMTFTLMVLVYLVVVTAEPAKDSRSDIAFVELFVPQSLVGDIRDRCIEHASYVLFRSGEYSDDPRVQECAREVVKRVSEYRKL